MSETDGEHELQKTTGVFSTLLGNGDWLYFRGEYKKAIESYTSALALKPDDKTCFVGRSKCYLKLSQSGNALKDADASLAKDKTYFEGLYQKAEALYHMGEFEFALVFYHRGQSLRPQVQEFRLGIQKAQEAIENSVERPPTIKLKIKGDLSFLQKEQEKAQTVNAIQHLKKEKKLQNQKSSKNEISTKQLLGEFYSDKKYLENLLKDEDLVKGKTNGGEQLGDVIQNCLSYLDTCTELWSQEKPICARVRDGKLMQKTSIKPRHRTPPETTQFLLRSLDDIDAELASGNAEGSLKKAEEIMKILQGWSERDVPNKREVLGSLHSCIGNALTDLGEIDKALDHHKKDLELAEQCKLPDALSRALDNIGGIYAQIGKFSQAIKFWEKKIPLVCGGLEKTWLFHEIGWCYLELTRYKEARDYGVRSVAAADEIADEKWQINANVLVAQSEWKLGNFDSCVSHFEKAMTQAKLQEDETAVKAIQKALVEVRQHLQQ